MSYTFVTTEKITAPRNLTRKYNKPEIIQTMWGPVDRTVEPSVGGEVEWSHDIYRCVNCRALAVVYHGSDAPKGKCGKCGA